MSQSKLSEKLEEAPPFLGSWRNVYLLVLGELVVLIVLFYAFSRWFG